MALKDLQSDLSKLRDVLDDRGFEDKFPSRVEEGVYAPEPTPIQGVYQDNTNRKTVSPIDNQIKKGVDFFDDTEGGAKGFVPKTNLESFYNKVQEGNVVPPRTHDGTYYANLNPIEGRKSNFRTDSGNYRFMRRGTNPPSQAYNDDIFYPAFSMGNQTTFYGIAGFNIGNQPAGNAYNSPFQPLPPYNFLNSPISNYVSSFNDNPFSVTLGTEAEPIRGDTVYNNRTFTIVNQPVNSWQSPLIPNAHMVAKENTDSNKTFDVTTMDDMVYGGYNLPEQKSSAGNAKISIDHTKRRGVYNQMINTLFEHQPFPTRQNPQSVFAPSADDRYFSENDGKSIHISPAGELKAGFRYGAYQTAVAGATGEQFVNFNPGNELNDVSSAPHPLTVELGDRYSTYSNYPHINAEPPSNLIVGDETILAKWPDRAKTNLLSAFPSTNQNPYDIGTVVTSNISDFFDKKSGVEKDGYDDLFEFSGGQFRNVPDGLNTNNKFGTKSYKSVANQGPFAGNDRHPLILRKVGNNWGSDRFEAGSIGEIVGGLITSGAPGLTGLIDRNVTDKLRIAKFLISPQGLSFGLKQVAMQALNPTIESKIWNPLSLFGVVGMAEFADTIENIVRGGVGFDDIPQTLKGMAKAAVSVAFPIGHVDRHLRKISDGRYENLLVTNKGAGSPLTVLIVGDEKSYQPTYGRIAATAYAFGHPPEEVTFNAANTGFGLLDDFIDKKIQKAKSALENAQLVSTFIMSNPNRYAFPFSSAPKSIEEGVPSFKGTIDLAQADITKAFEGRGGFTSADGVKRGGTFNPQSHLRKKEKSTDIQTHFTLPYEKLKSDFGYENNLTSMEQRLAEEITDPVLPKRKEFSKINSNIGSAKADPSAEIKYHGSKGQFAGYGLLKGDAKSGNVDKLNILPVMPAEEGGKLPTRIEETKDFIKFRIKDVVNNKYLIFRAILSGITDTVQPEFNEIKYIGRPDTLYSYKGVGRDIAFNFKIYPKTKQELAPLMEKLNHLTGLCYPSYTEGERMVTPFVELTIGDLFVDTPGILGSLTHTVEDATTWEIDQGLQFPHFISVACTFKHIGKYIPVTTGKHYDLSWYRSGNLRDGNKPIGIYENSDSTNPARVPLNTDPSDDEVISTTETPFLNNLLNQFVTAAQKAGQELIDG